MKHLRRALEINPRGVNAYVTLAHVLVFQKKFDEARLEFERAIAIDPYNASARNDLGSTFFEQGEIDESIPHYEAALAIDPNFVLAHVNLADALAAQGESTKRSLITAEPCSSIHATQKPRATRQAAPRRPKPPTP